MNPISSLGTPGRAEPARDPGAVPTDLEGDRRRRRGIDNFCKENPGRVHPRTHVLCPM